MKINELFEMLLSSGLNDCERTRVQNLVRKILVGRGGLALANDIGCVFQARNDVALHLGVQASALDAIWELQPVMTYLQESGLVKSKVDEQVIMDEGTGDVDDDGDEDYVPETESDDDSESVTDSFDERVVSDTTTLAAIQDVQKHISGLRRQVFWIGGAAVLMHSMSALLTVVMLMVPHTNILPLPLHVYLQNRSMRAMINQAVALWHRYWP